MPLKKITEADLLGKGIIPLPPRPGLGAKPLQSRFDQLAREVIVPVLNENVGEQEPINRQVPQAVEDSSYARSKSNEAYQIAKKALTATQEGGGFVFSPVTGLRVTVQAAFNDLYGLLRLNSVTAAEYASYNLTAEQYASYQMTARQYSLEAKTILGG